MNILFSLASLVQLSVRLTPTVDVETVGSFLLICSFLLSTPQFVRFTLYLSQKIKKGFVIRFNVDWYLSFCSLTCLQTVYIFIDFFFTVHVHIFFVAYTLQWNYYYSMCVCITLVTDSKLLLKWLSQFIISPAMYGSSHWFTFLLKWHCNLI